MDANVSFVYLRCYCCAFYIFFNLCLCGTFSPVWLFSEIPQNSLMVFFPLVSSSDTDLSLCTFCSTKVSFSLFKRFHVSYIHHQIQCFLWFLAIFLSFLLREEFFSIIVWFVHSINNSCLNRNRITLFTIQCSHVHVMRWRVYDMCWQRLKMLFIL